MTSEKLEKILIGLQSGSSYASRTMRARDSSEVLNGLNAVDALIGTACMLFIHDLTAVRHGSSMTPLSSPLQINTGAASRIRGFAMENDALRVEIDPVHVDVDDDVVDYVRLMSPKSDTCQVWLTVATSRLEGHLPFPVRDDGSACVCMCTAQIVIYEAP